MFLYWFKKEMCAHAVNSFSAQFMPVTDKSVQVVDVKYLYPAFTKVKILAFTVYSSLCRICRAQHLSAPCRSAPPAVPEILIRFGPEVPFQAVPTVHLISEFPSDTQEQKH